MPKRTDSLETPYTASEEIFGLQSTTPLPTTKKPCLERHAKEKRYKKYTRKLYNKNLDATEQSEQETLVQWLKLKNIWHYAIPNGAWTKNYGVAVNLKKAGLSPGTPDICIPTPKNGKHGLYIEMKPKSGGKVSLSQIGWIKYLTEAGYVAKVAHGFDHAMQIVYEYFQ